MLNEASPDMKTQLKVEEETKQSIMHDLGVEYEKPCVHDITPVAEFILDRRYQFDAESDET